MMTMTLVWSTVKANPHELSDSTLQCLWDLSSLKHRYLIIGTHLLSRGLFQFILIITALRKRWFTKSNIFALEIRVEVSHPIQTVANERPRCWSVHDSYPLLPRRQMTPILWGLSHWKLTNLTRWLQFWGGFSSWPHRWWHKDFYFWSAKPCHMATNVSAIAQTWHSYQAAWTELNHTTVIGHLASSLQG